MAVKIRLQRKGRKKAPYYYVVVADARSPRDGKFIERIGSYNPVPKIAEVNIDIDKAINWLDKGAIPTKTVKNLLSKEGVLYKKHLIRGVKLEVLTQEEADQKFNEYIIEKTQKEEADKSKLSASEDKVLKNKLAKETEVNEARAKKIMEKRKAEIEENMPEEVQEEIQEKVEEVAVEATPETPVVETTPEAPVKEVPVKEVPAKEEAPAKKEAPAKEEAPSKEKTSEESSEKKAE